MVDAYATTLGSLTLAIDAEHFLVEDSDSGGILSLRPAFTSADGEQPRPFERVHGFATSDDRMEVTWEPVSGLAATTSLTLIEARRVRFETRLTNSGESPVAVVAVHPLHYPIGGPGACALGMLQLRALVADDLDAPPRLAALDRDNVVGRGFAAWFDPSGSPTVFLGGCDGAADSARIAFSGARGKIIGLRIDVPSGDDPISPGESLPVAAFVLALGDTDVRDEYAAWTDVLGDAAPAAFRDFAFDPSADIPEVAPDEDEEEPDALSLDEDADEEPEGDDEEEEANDLPAADAGLVEDEPAAVAAADPRPGRRTRCASFQRALRVSEGIWPRWAMGRSYPPQGGMAARARDHWRRQS